MGTIIREPELRNSPEKKEVKAQVTVAPIPHKPLNLTIPKEYLHGNSLLEETTNHSELLPSTLFENTHDSIKKDDAFNISGRLFFEVDEEDYLNSKIEGGKINIEIKAD